MGEKTNPNKIGARCLSENEARMILPTYDQIWDQIEQFRLQKTHSDISQKTNNIGIIGIRGAGKTSLLKTIRAMLEKNNKDKLNKDKKGADLIFPIIVPENMSQSSTLMATILGMLKEFVDAQVRREETKKRDEYCIRESECKQKYDEVIKQYTYIQKEYRDIMIQEYTTENDYARSSAKIFNSDVEFQKKFNELIRLLLKESNQAMIFLFIDDIDLSTYRCADVVKTLLSYLSNENIITFISGDLETFEEALTLDFLRQEGVLEKNILNESMLEGTAEVTVLESKKKLSYEYLKKILPPVFRHNIKMWDLEEKGNYHIQSEEEDQSEGGLFSECLTEALKDWVDPAFFQYIDVWDEKKPTGILPYTYHLFDDTSRGLNNVYNVLNDIIFNRNKYDSKNTTNSEVDDFIIDKRQLLDTIISSKHLYNQYRGQIHGNMFFIGTERSHVNFDNALAVIYPDTKDEIDYPIQSPVERFALFIFVDFAARLLYEKEYEKRTAVDNDYQKLKKLAVKDLLLHPEIAGKVRNIDIDLRKWEEYIKNINDIYNPMSSDLSTRFLIKGNLIFNLAFYKSLSLELIQLLYAVNDKKNDSIELEQKVFLAFGNAVTSIAKIREIENAQLLADEYYSTFWREFQYIQNRLSSLSKQNEIIRLFGTTFETSIYKERPYEYRIILNTIAELIPEQDQINNSDDIQPEERTLNKEEQNTLTIKKIISIIAHKELWRKLPAETVIKHLKLKVMRVIAIMISVIKDSSKNIKIDIQNAIDDWDKFYKSDDGVTYTKAAKTKDEILNYLYHAIPENQKSGSSDPDEVIKIIEQNGVDYQTFNKIMESAKVLAENSRAWYGRVEAQELQNGMLKSFLKIDDLKEHYTNLEDFKFYLTYYYNYKIAISDKKEIKNQADLLKEITECISTAHQNADKQVLESFMDQLNEGLEDKYKISSDMFKELFK